jgi:ornithine cyclodeaminase
VVRILDSAVAGAAAADLLARPGARSAAVIGELHHALKADLPETGSVDGELTAVASGRLAGRTADDDLSVADLTGRGIQDAAVAVLGGDHRAGRDW